MFRFVSPRSLLSAATALALVGVAVLLLRSPALRSEDQPPGPDPAASSIALAREDAPAGFHLASTRAGYLQWPAALSSDGRPAAYRDYRPFVQVWESDGPPYGDDVVVWLSYCLLPTEQDAAWALAGFLKNSSEELHRGELSDAPRVGDTTFGRYPGNTLFVRGRAVVSVHLETGPALSGQQAAIMDGFVEATVRKLDQAGMQPRPPLAVNLKVSSRHVNTPRREVVRLHLSSDERPMNYSFRCYRVADRPLPGELGDLVFDQSRFCQEPDLDFEWSGLDNQGQPVSNGRYQMRIGAEDLLRRYQEFEVDVQVNNQGAR